MGKKARGARAVPPWRVGRIAVHQAHDHPTGAAWLGAAPCTEGPGWLPWMGRVGQRLGDTPCTEGPGWLPWMGRVGQRLGDTPCTEGE